VVGSGEQGVPTFGFHKDEELHCQPERTINFFKENSPL
jgi:hypothetical protein